MILICFTIVLRPLDYACRMFSSIAFRLRITIVVNYIANFCACAKFVAPSGRTYFKFGGAAPVDCGNSADSSIP